MEIDGKDVMWSVAFLEQPDRDHHIVCGGNEGKVRRWRVRDGSEVGTPMDVGSLICSIAVSRDGKWIVSGAKSGQVTVWRAENHEKAIEFKGHNDSVYAVDIVPDGTKIMTGSADKTACVWSFNGKQLLAPFAHDFIVVAVKASPDGCLLATATWCHNSIRIYDSQNGSILLELLIQVSSPRNDSLAWAHDSRQLFALSHDGNVYCLDVLTRQSFSKWAIHSQIEPRCVSLESNGAFIAATDRSSVSFWDTITHNQIGPVIYHPATILSMAISTNGDFLIGGDGKTTLWNLREVLPPSYLHHVHVHRMPDAKDKALALCSQEETFETPRTTPDLNQIHYSLRTQDEFKHSSVSTTTFLCFSDVHVH